MLAFYLLLYGMRVKVQFVRDGLSPGLKHILGLKRILRAKTYLRAKAYLTTS